ncbi:MAG: hypothetical protein ACR2HJ_03295 [Fimbriimonadales bacterium]
MQKRINEDAPYENALDRRAQLYFQSARGQGSLVPDDELMKECRELARRDLQRIERLGDEVYPEEEQE